MTAVVNGTLFSDTDNAEVGSCLKVSCSVSIVGILEGIDLGPISV